MVQVENDNEWKCISRQEPEEGAVERKRDGYKDRGRHIPLGERVGRRKC